MADSPTGRKSSIPILKQTNKTKSFQSYVNLHLNDELNNEQQKSRSPSTSPTENVHPKLPLNRAQMKQNLPKLEIDNDIVITKLCDENKRLKDHQTQLISKYEEGKVDLFFLRYVITAFFGSQSIDHVERDYQESKIELFDYWLCLEL